MALLSIRDLFARLNEVDESREIEAKRSESELGKSALETISAFSNEPGLGGGYLLFGVEEKESRRFVARGIADPKKLEQELSSRCAAAFNRTVRPRVWTEVIDGTSLVAAFIPEAVASEKPVFIEARGMHHGSFRRIGSTDQRCTEDDLRVLFQAASLTPYEDSLVDDATMDDLDPEVISSYRRSLIDVNPATDLRDASPDELVQSLGAARRVNGALVPTVAGVLLFGKRLALRRLFPAARVDYVRVPGVEWVPDPDSRYDSIDVREPLLFAFRRIYNAIVDDLPKSFALEPGNPERRDQLALPEAAVREALVNALTHRDFRVASAVQVIRYQDRIEVRNPGYSLVDDDQLGEPGSFPRNPRIADFFREMRLAENKGTGIAAIRRGMQRAGLTPPVFDSDRARNRFVVALWLHNLISEDHTSWLRGFSSLRLSDEQARALVVARRTGSVSNAMLRDVSGLDTLGASNQLRQLRDLGLLELRGRGSATHYVLGANARVEQRQGFVEGQTGGFAEGQTGGLPEGREPQTRELARQTQEFDEQTPELGAQTRGSSAPQRQGLSRRQRQGLAGPQRQGLPIPQRQGLSAVGDQPARIDALLNGISAQLREAIDELGGKPSPAALRSLIERLCEQRWWTPKELAAVLKRRSVSRLAVRHLYPLVRESRLERRYPDNPAHPQQAYRTRRSAESPEETE